MALILPSISHLTERQYQLYFLFQGVIARHRPDGFSRLIDEDVAQASGAVAATLETSARGVLYEHTPASLPAQRLAREMTAMLAELRAQGTKIYDGETAIALRAIESGARELARTQTGDDAYIAVMGRLIQAQGTQKPQEQANPPSPLIVP